MMTTYAFDIVIVGGGIVGLTLAACLSDTSLSIAIIEAQTIVNNWNKDSYDQRVSAITLSSERIFSHLNLWENLTSRRVSPFKGIHVWDGLSQAAIHFNAREINEHHLGSIIENNLIQSILLEKLKNNPMVQIFSNICLSDIKEKDHSICLITKEGESYEGRIAIAADGAHSWLRQKAGILMQKRDYEEEAIVCRVETEEPHLQIARQVFCPSGPLAFLPLLNKNTSSIVWSLPEVMAQKMAKLNQEAFQSELNHSFSHRLGKIVNVSERSCFPLIKQKAHSYLKSRVILVGDAAHAVHPLAGQGVNMGILDAVCLHEIIKEALLNKKDFSNSLYLRRYERWRKADNLNMMQGIDFIKQFFVSDKKVVSSLRQLGLKAVNQSDMIKQFFMSYAVGNRTGLPKMATSKTYFLK